MNVFKTLSPKLVDVSFGKKVSKGLYTIRRCYDLCPVLRVDMFPLKLSPAI